MNDTIVVYLEGQIGRLEEDIARNESLIRGAEYSIEGYYIAIKKWKIHLESLKNTLLAYKVSEE